MAAIELNVFARSDVGRVRTNNEDSFTITDLQTGDTIEVDGALRQVDVRERGVLMVVSDGMGGHAAGEVASALVVDSLRKSLGETDGGAESMQRLIDRAVNRANEDVWKAAREGRKHGMGATLTAVLVHEREAYIAEVGDSRAYLHRSGRLRQMTKDQSFVQLLVDAGEMTAEQAKDAPQKNLILQAMGLERSVQVSIGRLHLRRGDRLLLCSDGLTNHVTDYDLAELLNVDDLAETCNRMISLANQRGGEDNVTAIVAHFDGEGLPYPCDQESVTQTFSVLQEFGKLPLAMQDRDAPEEDGAREQPKTDPPARRRSGPPARPRSEPPARQPSTMPPTRAATRNSSKPPLAAPAASQLQEQPAWAQMAFGAAMAIVVSLIIWYVWLR